MNSSEKVFYGGNTQFSLKGCRSIELQSEQIDRHIHHALCSNGGEQWMVINNEKSWSMDTILRQELSINSMDASRMDVLALAPTLWALQCPMKSTIGL